MNNIVAENLKIYRKRIIPNECILLKDDEIVECNSNHIVTKWKTLKPKADFTHGASCYMLNDGIKVSKFYKPDGDILYWYCDIVDYSYSEEDNSLVVTDLLADVIVYPDGNVKIMDLDELAEALDNNLIDANLIVKCLVRLNSLLSIIDRDKFEKYQSYLN